MLSTKGIVISTEHSERDKHLIMKNEERVNERIDFAKTSASAVVRV